MVDSSIFNKIESENKSAMPLNDFRAYLTDIATRIAELSAIVRVQFELGKEYDIEIYKQLIIEVMTLYKLIKLKLDKKSEDIKTFEKHYNNFTLAKLKVSTVLNVADELIDFLVRKGLIDVLQLKVIDTIIDDEVF